MRRIGNNMDRVLLLLLVALIVVGFFLFSSASLGLLARNGARFSTVAFSQLILGVGLGSLSMFLISRIQYRILKKYSLHFFIFSLLVTLLVFVPYIGITAGGASRWISIGPFSLQPAEILKLGTILYLATYLSSIHGSIHSFKQGLLPFGLILAFPTLVLVFQPDTSTLVVIAIAAMGMFVAVGARWRDIGILFITGLLAFGALLYIHPYIFARIKTFIYPTQNQQSSGYQITQSRIAIGSGEIIGRGFGQSVQKFGYLPEPTGDSIFAVAAEEFGFVGTTIILLLFMGLFIRSCIIAARAPDYFGGVLVLGIILLITVQAFINISSMTGVLPLTGLPLPFISHGGTALFVMLSGMGIILNISKYSK